MTRTATANPHWYRRKPSDPATECPRCGYDLFGAIGLWEDAWPLSVTCSECGRECSVKDIIIAHRRPPAWSFEHAHRRPLQRWGDTALRSLWPWRFYEHIRPGLDIHRQRLLAFAALWCAAWAIVWYSVIAVLNIASVVLLTPSPWSVPRHEFLRSLLWPFTQPDVIASMSPYIGAGTLAAIS